jgi:iron uptake system component EfeO
MTFRTSAAALTACAALLVPLGACSSGDSTDTAATTTQTAPADPRLAAASAGYVEYVRTEVAALLAGTDAFVDAYIAGDNESARSLYAPTRMHWERIEPVAEAFGDLDPKTDAREADLEPGQEWTGWHLLEKDLWPPTAEANGGKNYEPLSTEDRSKYATELRSDLGELETLVTSQDFPSTITAESIANGSKELLDEVANGKITGEEEIWSHTDLWDFQANLDGAKKGYDLLRDVAMDKDAELAATLDERFKAIQDLLDTHRQGEGFVLYTALSEDAVRALSDAVDALSEPLSKLATTVKN